MEVAMEEAEGAGMEAVEAEEGGAIALWTFAPNIRLRSLVQLEFCPAFMVAGQRGQEHSVRMPAAILELFNRDMW